MKLRPRQTYILRAILAYLILASAWILISDLLLTAFAEVPAIQWLSTVKGIFFVVVTTLLLFYALRGVPGGAGIQVPPGLLAGTGRWSRIWLYLFAIAITLGMLLIRSGIAVSFGERPLLIILIFPVILSAMAGGCGPGLTATLLAALGAEYYGLPPRRSFAIAASHDFFQLAIFVINGVLVSVLSEFLHRLRREQVFDRQLQAVTLASIGDGVITTDRNGLVTYLNPEAERLTGWSSGLAKDRPLAEIFPLIGDQDREALADPVQQVLNSGEKRAIANHTLLLARGGREIPIQDSAAPIRLGDGTILGVVLVFSDDTRRRQAASVVREERALYQDLVNAQPAGIYRIRVRSGQHWDREVFSSTGRAPYVIEIASDRFCEILATSHQELQNDPGLISRRLHPEDEAGFLRANEEANAGPRPFNWEGRLLSGGQIKWVQFQSLPRKLDNGDVVWTGILTDIGIRKKAEEALRRSETTYRSLFDHMLNGLAYCRMLFVDDRPEDFIYLTVNAAFEKLTGLREVEGRRVSEVIPGIRQADPELFERYGRVARGGPPERFEIYVAALKMWFWISVYSPKPDHFVAVFDVITERKQAELALRESEEQLRSLSDNLPDGYLYQTTLGADGRSRFLFVSAGVTRIHGVTPEEVRRDPGVLYGQVDPAQARELAQAEKDSIVSLRDFVMELRFRRPDGNWGWLQIRSRPRRRPDGILVWDGAVIDITRQKIMENQLQQSQKIESIGRLAGGVAHDFNNMLTIISGHTELALEQLQPGEPLYQDLLEIRDAASRSANLTRKLLAFARKQAVNPVVLDLNDTLAGMLKMLQRLIGEDIELAWLPGHDLWPVKIDPSQVDQLLANLTVNARDAINGVGKLTIETGNIELDEEYCANHQGFVPGRFVQLEVSDNGCGMNSDTLAHIFEPFFTTKEEGRGTGLGLAMVYGIVKQNRGFINVYSEPGQGSTFRIYLPRAEEVTTAAAITPSREEPPRGTETILIVEDDQAILDLGRRFTERLGYKVLTAGTPALALQLAREYPGAIDLLVTDVVMPEMNGKELAGMLREIKPEIKYLFMSGYTADAIGRHGILDQGICFLAKPFSAREIALKVREALSQPEISLETQTSR